MGSNPSRHNLYIEATHCRDLTLIVDKGSSSTTRWNSDATLWHLHVITFFDRFFEPLSSVIAEIAVQDAGL